MRTFDWVWGFIRVNFDSEKILNMRFNPCCLSRVESNIFIENQGVSWTLDVSEVLYKVAILLLIHISLFLAEASNAWLLQCLCIHIVSSFLIYSHLFVGIWDKCIIISWYLLIQHREVKHFEQRVCTWKWINSLISCILIPTFVEEIPECLWEEILIAKEWTLRACCSEISSFSTKSCFEMLNKSSFTDVHSSIYR